MIPFEEDRGHVISRKAQDSARQVHHVDDVSTFHYLVRSWATILSHNQPLAHPPALRDCDGLTCRPVASRERFDGSSQVVIMV